MSRKAKIPEVETLDHTADDVVEENANKKARESKRDTKLADELMYGKKAYKRTVRDTIQERDSKSAQLHSFGGAGKVTMAWDLNDASIRDQVFMLNVGKETTYISAVELQKYLRWI